MPLEDKSVEEQKGGCAALGAGSAGSERERTPPGPTGYGPVLRRVT